MYVGLARCGPCDVSILRRYMCVEQAAARSGFGGWLYPGWPYPACWAQIASGATCSGAAMLHTRRKKHHHGAGAIRRKKPLEKAASGPELPGRARHIAPLAAPARERGEFSSGVGDRQPTDQRLRPGSLRALHDRGFAGAGRSPPVCSSGGETPGEPPAGGDRNKADARPGRRPPGAGERGSRYFGLASSSSAAAAALGTLTLSVASISG